MDELQQNMPPSFCNIKV